MNAPVSVTSSDVSSRLGIIDCDIHPYPKAGALNKYLSERWRNHVFQYGKFNCGPYADRGTYPRFSPNTSRRDSWPPNGGSPGSDVDFIRDATAGTLQHRLWRAGAASRRQYVAKPG